MHFDLSLGEVDVLHATKTANVVVETANSPPLVVHLLLTKNHTLITEAIPDVFNKRFQVQQGGWGPRRMRY